MVKEPEIRASSWIIWMDLDAKLQVLKIDEESRPNESKRPLELTKARKQILTSAPGKNTVYPYLDLKTSNPKNSKKINLYVLITTVVIV